MVWGGLRFTLYRLSGWLGWGLEGLSFTVNPIKLETRLRPNSAGIPYILLLRVEAIGFPTFGLLL